MTGQELQVLKGHVGQIVGLRFTPDSKTLLSAGWHGDQSVIVWDVATGNEERRFKGHTAVITCMDLTPDGKHFITSSQDGTPRIWDYAEGKEIRSLKYGSANFSLASDGRSLVILAQTKTVFVDIHTGEVTRELKVGGDRLEGCCLLAVR